MAAEDIELDGDAGNLGRIAAHGVSPQEVEQVLDNDPLDLDYQIVDGEERWVAVGVTNRGRFLVVVWAIRESSIRVITAFDADKSYQQVYLKQGGK